MIKSLIVVMTNFTHLIMRMFEGSKLKAFEKCYYKRTQEEFELVREKIDGVDLEKLKILDNHN